MSKTTSTRTQWSMAAKVWIALLALAALPGMARAAAHGGRPEANREIRHGIRRAQPSPNDPGEPRTKAPRPAGASAATAPARPGTQSGPRVTQFAPRQVGGAAVPPSGATAPAHRSRHSASRLVPLRPVPPVADRRTRARGAVLTVGRAVAMALRQNPRIRMAAFKQRAARLRVKAARGALLPRVKFEATGMVWDSAVKFTMPPMDPAAFPPPPDDCPLPPSCMGYMGNLFGSMDLGTIRDQFTLQVGVTVAEPITALFALLKKLRIRHLGVDVARLERKQVALGLTYQVTKTYLQVLQVEAIVGIAQDAVRLLEAHERQVLALRRAEMVSQIEVLRIKVALSSTRQGLARARAGASMARAALRMLIGARASARFDLVSRFPDPPPPLHRSLAWCQSRAIARRPELAVLRGKQSMAKAGVAASRIMLWPNAVIMANYTHNEGMGTLQPKNSFFAGLSLSWSWEWGSKYRESQALSAETGQLVHAIEAVRRGVLLEVRQHYLAAQTAWKNLASARVAVQEATVALRLERRRFGQGVKTATDLLDAQSRYNRARTQYNNALYGFYAARAGLDAAMGDLVTARQGSRPRRRSAASTRGGR